MASRPALESFSEACTERDLHRNGQIAQEASQSQARRSGVEEALGRICSAESPLGKRLSCRGIVGGGSEGERR